MLLSVCTVFQITKMIADVLLNLRHITLGLCSTVTSIFLNMYCTFTVGTHWHIVSEKCFCGGRKKAGVVLLVLYQAKHNFRVVFHNLYILNALYSKRLEIRHLPAHSVSSCPYQVQTASSCPQCDVMQGSLRFKPKNTHPSAWDKIVPYWSPWYHLEVF